MRLSALPLLGFGLVLAAQAGGAPSRARPASFRHDVAPVLVRSCATVSCHGGGAHPPDIDPDAAPADLRRALLGVASEERPERTYVKPGDAQASYLIDKLEGRLMDSQCADQDCGERMPARNPALSEAARADIRAWIAQGAADN